MPALNKTCCVWNKNVIRTWIQITVGKQRSTYVNCAVESKIKQTFAKFAVVKHVRTASFYSWYRLTEYHEILCFSNATKSARLLNCTRILSALIITKSSCRNAVFKTINSENCCIFLSKLYKLITYVDHRCTNKIRYGVAVMIRNWV